MRSLPEGHLNLMAESAEVPKGSRIKLPMGVEQAGCKALSVRMRIMGEKVLIPGGRFDTESVPLSQAIDAAARFADSVANFLNARSVQDGRLIISAKLCLYVLVTRT